MTDQDSLVVMAALRSRIELILSSSEPLTKKDVERRLRSNHPELQFNKSTLTKVLKEHFQQLPPNHLFFPIPLWTTVEARSSVPAVSSAEHSSPALRRHTVGVGDSAPSSPADELLEDEPEGLPREDRRASGDDIRLQRERERRRQQVSGPTGLDMDGANYRKGIDRDSPLNRVADRALGRMTRERPKYIDSD